jgi:protein FRG1
LTATPSGQLSATTPSRGPLEALTPALTPSSSSSLFPSLSLKTHSETYISVSPPASTSALKAELRGDVDSLGANETFRIKCQREFVLKARIAVLEAKEGGGQGKKRLLNKGPVEGSLEDELARKWVPCYRCRQTLIVFSKEAQTWGAGKAIVSEGDRKDLKRARKEGRIAEAMLDRRAALKR